jgi:DDE superfamily endonuclease
VLKPHLKEQWVIPPEARGEFVARMEDLLEVYHRPYNERRPLVCLDEIPVQLVGETRVPLPARPGRPERYDYEYVRSGKANLFMVFEPLLGWRWVKVTERRTARDLAEVLRELVEEIHEGAERVVLVTDNLNTHGPGCLYEAFEPERARRIAAKLEWHYTPVHGSWLNVAKVELAALARQCLGRRIGSIEELAREVAAWQDERNEAQVGARWQFTTAKARVKLRRLYPSLQ